MQIFCLEHNLGRAYVQKFSRGKWRGPWYPSNSHANAAHQAVLVWGEGQA